MYVTDRRPLPGENGDNICTRDTYFIFIHGRPSFNKIFHQKSI